MEYENDQINTNEDLQLRITRLECTAKRLEASARSMYDALYELRREIYGYPQQNWSGDDK